MLLSMGSTTTSENGTTSHRGTTAHHRPAADGRARDTPPRPQGRSRAVLRDIEPGSLVECAHCNERLKFVAKTRPKQVICNVYDGDRWERVEHFHLECYEPAGSPHGEVDTTPVMRRRAAPARSGTATPPPLG